MLKHYLKAETLMRVNDLLITGNINIQHCVDPAIGKVRLEP